MLRTACLMNSVCYGMFIKFLWFRIRISVIIGASYNVILMSYEIFPILKPCTEPYTE